MSKVKVSKETIEEMLNDVVSLYALEATLLARCCDPKEYDVDEDIQKITDARDAELNTYDEEHIDQIMSKYVEQYEKNGELCHDDHLTYREALKWDVEAMMDISAWIDCSDMPDKEEYAKHIDKMITKKIKAVARSKKANKALADIIQAQVEAE